MDIDFGVIGAKHRDVGIAYLGESDAYFQELTDIFASLGRELSHFRDWRGREIEFF